MPPDRNADKAHMRAVCKWFFTPDAVGISAGCLWHAGGMRPGLLRGLAGAVGQSDANITVPQHGKASAAFKAEIEQNRHGGAGPLQPREGRGECGDDLRRIGLGNAESRIRPTDGRRQRLAQGFKCGLFETRQHSGARGRRRLASGEASQSPGEQKCETRHVQRSGNVMSRLESKTPSMLRPSTVCRIGTNCGSRLTGGLPGLTTVAGHDPVSR